MSDSVSEMYGEIIRNIFVCSCYLLFNVMEVLSVGGGALLDVRHHHVPCMVIQRIFVLYLCASMIRGMVIYLF